MYLLLGFILLILFLILILLAFRFENRLRKICPDRKKEFFLSPFGSYNFLRYFKKMDCFQANDKTLRKLKRNIVLIELMIIVVFITVAVYSTMR
jgi:hypothetical protein